MNRLTTYKGKLKQFNRWKKKHFRELRKKCKKCRFKPELCNHCYNDEVRIINEKIDFFGVGDTIKKLEYNII